MTDQAFIIHCCYCWLATKLCLTLGDSMDYSLSGSSVQGISQVRILSGLPFPTPGDLPGPGIKPESPALVGGFFTTETPGKNFL